MPTKKISSKTSQVFDVDAVPGRGVDEYMRGGYKTMLCFGSVGNLVQ